MSYIGSIDYAGMLGERNDNVRINPQEGLKTHHEYLNQQQAQHRDERRNTIQDDPIDPEDARVDDDHAPKHSGGETGKHAKDQPSEETPEPKYIFPVDEDLGQKFDFSA